MEKRTKLTVIAIFFALSLVIPGMSLAADPGDVQIHGFVSQGYLYTGTNEFLADTKAGSFEFNEVGVNFTAEPFEKLRIGVQLFSRDLGAIDNNRIDLDWAFADYRWRDELGIRIGRIKTPVGLSLETIDLDMSRTSIFLPLSCYEPRYRAITFSLNGVGLYGTIKLGHVGGLEYSGVLGTNSISKEAMENQYDNIMDVDSIRVRLAYGGRLIWNTPLKGFLVGGSYFFLEDLEAKGSLLPEMTAPIPQLGGLSLFPAGTKVNFRTKKINAYNLFAQYARNKFTFTGEYMDSDLDSEIIADNPYDPLVASLIGFNGLNLDSLHFAGWYAQTDYQFLDWFTAALAYGEYYPDVNDPYGDDVDPSYINYQKDATVSLRFDINNHWNVKLEAHFISGIAIAIADFRSTYSGGLDENWNLYAVKTSFYF